MDVVDRQAQELSEHSAALCEFLAGRRTFVLTGAGCSTESGIPDYRGPKTRAKARNPIQDAEFRSSEEVRRRYWARSVVGWPKIASKQPNAAHTALAALQRSGHVLPLVTQNVDGLHQAGGSSEVVELHGALRDVMCLDCDVRSSRAELQTRLVASNPERATEGPAAPDGDADVEPTRDFVVPACLACGGALKPDVVFFGGSVPKSKVEQAFARFDEADALLVIGSSLAVFSGYRFARRAHREGKPYALLNLGEARGQELAQLHVEARAGELLPQVVAMLAGD